MRRYLPLVWTLALPFVLSGCVLFNMIGGSMDRGLPVEENTRSIDPIFEETFDAVPDGANLRDHFSQADNPDSFDRSRMSGTITIDGGVVELGSQRIAIEIPGLANVENPILKVAIKNDNGSGSPVPNLKLAVGNRYSTSGGVGEDGYRAHGEHHVTHSDFQVLEIPLDPAHTHTNLLNFRGIVGASSTAGLFIDWIQVIAGSGGGSDARGEPGAPGDGPSGPDDPDIPPEGPETIDDAYFGLVGYASMNGGVTGGAGPNGRVVFVSTGQQLHDELYANERRHKGDKKYGDPVPLVIYVNGTITPTNSGGQRKIDMKDQAAVSIIGLGDGGEFDGTGLKIVRSQNVIIRNLRIHHIRSPEDGIEIQDSSNIWIDRNSIYNDLLLNNKDFHDGLLDIKGTSEYITVSWNKFYNNAKGLLVGHNDTPGGQPDKITYHHNHFYNLGSRAPLIRHATVHLFNNLFEDIHASATNVRMGAQARIENNYYDNVGSGTVDSHAGQIEGPIGWWYGSPQTGYWHVLGNVFVNSPVSSYQSTTTVSVPYDYSMALNSAERARQLVQQYAGAGSPSL